MKQFLAYAAIAEPGHVTKFREKLTWFARWLSEAKRYWYIYLKDSENGKKYEKHYFVMDGKACFGTGWRDIRSKLRKIQSNDGSFTAYVPK